MDIGIRKVKLLLREHKSPLREEPKYLLMELNYNVLPHQLIQIIIKALKLE